MKKFIIPILLAISLVFNVYLLYQNSKNLTVKEVHDGDTFTLFDGSRVRLLGIDAPEIGRCGADEAKNLLSSLVLGKKVKIVENKPDNYGRKMGLIYIGKKLINQEMLKSGWTRPDYSKNSKSEDLKTAFHYASQNKLGIFSKCTISEKATPPNPNCDIKGNVDQSSWEKKYYLPSCKYYKQVVLNTDLGEKYFCSEKEAQDAGFILASECGKYSQ